MGFIHWQVGRLGGLVGLLIAGLFLANCSPASSKTGNLEVRLYDHREAIGDFSKLQLTVSAVAIHPAGQPRLEGWVELKPALRELDLTQYVEGRQATIAQAAVESGAYNAIHLTIEAVSGTLISGQQVDVAAKVEPVALNFRIRGDRPTTVGLDLIVSDLSDHPGQGYELRVREAIVIP